MLRRFLDARLGWLTLCSLAALTVLVGLGTWQLQRKAWKEGLVAAIAARSAAEPMSLDQALGAIERGDSAEYLRVRVRGGFQHVAERHVFSAGPQGPGWLIFTPMAVPAGGGTRLLLVNRGWVPDALKAPESRSAGQLTGEAAVVGLLRRSEEPGWFTPSADPRRNMWYLRDIDALMPQSQGGMGRLPFLLDAEAAPVNPGGWPRGGTTNLKLPNRHLEYALTWFGLAATLVGVYLAFAARRLRSPGDPG
jgi:surfeit locus 1 family protein